MGPQIPPLDPPEASLAAAQSAATAVRAAGATIEDVVTASRRHANPDGWQGRASTAAGAAAAEFGRRADGASAALVAAVAAIETFGDQLAQVWSDFTALDHRRTSLQSQVDGLGADDDSTALRAAIQAWESDVRSWLARLTAAEDALVRALRGADSPREARELADGSRCDAAALAQQLRQRAGDPAAVHRWWRSLTEAQRQTLTLADPALVGSTDGIPAGDRDDANRAGIERDIDHLCAIDPRDLTPEQQAVLTRALSARDALDAARSLTSPDAVTGLPVPAQLLLYLPGAASGDGFAAVAYGDPDTAANTVVNVPGMMNDGSKIDGNASNALDLFTAINRHGVSVSSISWMGYDSPDVNIDEIAAHGILGGIGAIGHGIGDVGAVALERKAEVGGHALADFVSGLRTTHVGDPTHLTVIGHSYGSTTVAHGLADGLRAQTDDAVLIGSPGAGGGVDQASDLMAPGHLYVGSQDRDLVTWLGHRPGEYASGVPIIGDPLQDVTDRLGLGHDPAQADFGATRFDAGEGSALTGNPVQAAETSLSNHTSYYRGESLTHLAEIGAGERLDADAVIPGREENGLGLLEREYLDGVEQGLADRLEWLDRFDDLLAPRPVTFAGLFS